MNPLEVKLLNSVKAFFGHLDDIVDHHPVFVTIGVLYLLMLLAVLFIVYAIQRRAKGLIKPGGPCVIYIESLDPPPPPPEPPFNPFPPFCECDCERDYD